MLPRYLTAFEHQPIPIGDLGGPTELTSAEAEFVVRLSQPLPGFCERGHRSIRLKQFCGITSLGDRVLEILPKSDEARSPEDCRGVLLRLLRTAEDFRVFRHLPVGQHLRSAPLLDVFIAAFFDAVSELVRGGLLQQYQQREDDLQVVRGRIISSRQFAMHSNRPDRVACRYDDLTTDNVWNRLIKAGLRCVRPWIRSIDLNRRWIELMTVFDGIDDTQVDERLLSQLVFDRHAVRYRAAINWVRWILALLSPALRAGRSSSPGLLFNMNVLFESAIATILRRRASTGLTVHAQEKGMYLATVVGTGGRRALELKPDILVRRGDNVVAIGDTKWKVLEVSPSGFLTPEPADIYQMQAYAVAYQCEDLVLIYPWHSGLDGSRETAFELPRVGTLRPILKVVCVDVQTDQFRVRGDAGSEMRTLLSYSGGLT